MGGRKGKGMAGKAGKTASEALRLKLKGAECFGKILQASSDAIVVAGEDGRIVFWNAAAELLFGYAREEASALTIADLMPESYRDRHREGMERYMRTGEGRIMGAPVTVKGRRSDGSIFPIELSLAADRSCGQWVFAAIIRDITGRRAFEKKLARKSRLLAKANVELDILARVSALISQSIEMSSLLKTILDAVTGIDIFRLERRGGIMILRDGVLALAAHLGHNEDFLDRHRAVRVGECLCGRAVETGEVTTSLDSAADPRHTITYEGMAPHGHIIIPLKAKGAVVGVMYLYLQPGTRVEAGRMHFLESIGGMLGVAISNAMLYEDSRRLALHDPLTGLANRRLLGMELERNFALAKRYARPLSCLMLDLDHFKRYNDANGHVAGDELLRAVARAIASSLRETDITARYGGEEFCVLLPETGLESAVIVAERVREAVRGVGITASLGAASYGRGLALSTDLVEAADRALYMAKEAGRDRVVAAKTW